jgi:thiaminase/transcriptional activator TenA
MIQDYLFLIDYCKVISLAVTKSTDLNSMNHFSSLLNETLNSEMQLHRDFCLEIGISNNELESASAMPATLSYTNYLLSTAYNNSIEEIVASLLPCQWGYDEIGRNLENSTNAKDVLFINKWISGYTNSEYRDLTKWLINYVDQLSDNSSNTTKQKMMNKFLHSIRYEYLFWDSAWHLKGWFD